LGIYLEFSAPEITLKINISPVSESKSYQINSIKSYSSRSFHQHQRHIPKKKKLKFNLIFREEIIQVQTSWKAWCGMARAVAAKGGKLFPWFAWCGLIHI